jgi:hypothetical protein
MHTVIDTILLLQGAATNINVETGHCQTICVFYCIYLQNHRLTDNHFTVNSVLSELNSLWIKQVEHP